MSEAVILWIFGVRCLIRYNSDGRPYCLKGAIHRVRIACVHEHMCDMWVCDEHADMRHTCSSCLDADGHRCETRTVELPSGDYPLWARRRDWETWPATMGG